MNRQQRRKNGERGTPRATKDRSPWPARYAVGMDFADPSNAVTFKLEGSLPDFVIVDDPHGRIDEMTERQKALLMLWHEKCMGG